MGTSSRVLVLALATVGAPGASAKEPCLRYEPDVVELVGVVKRHTFPGPPNYESVTQGDAPERYWLLHLSQPLCVQPSDPGDKTQSPEPEVKSLQIIIRDYKRVRLPLGRRVRITGTLMHAVTGHHHTKVLIQASRIEPEA